MLVEEKAREVMELADIVAFMELGRGSGPGRDEVDEERLAAAYFGTAQRTRPRLATGVSIIGAAPAAAPTRPFRRSRLPPGPRRGAHRHAAQDRRWRRRRARYRRDGSEREPPRGPALRLAHDESGYEDWNGALVEHASENTVTLVRVA